MTACSSSPTKVEHTKAIPASVWLKETGWEISEPKKLGHVIEESYPYCRKQLKSCNGDKADLRKYLETK